MNYFQLLEIIFGSIALLKPVYMHLLPWNENEFLKKAYRPRRPVWIIPVVIAGLLLVAFTWYKEFTTNFRYSIIISVLFSLTAIKGVVLLFDYQKFYKWVGGMLAKRNGKDIIRLHLFASLFGLILIILSIILF